MNKELVLSAGHFHAIHRLGALCALDKGSFKEEGLDKVKVTATGDDELTIEGLKNGTIDFGLDVKPRLVFRENNNGEELYIIGGWINRLPCSFISVKEVKSIADLKGKRIGMVEKGTGRSVPWIRNLLRDHGVDPDKDVTWVPDSGFRSLKNQAPRLNRGDYDAIGLSGWYPRPELFKEIAKAGFNHLAELLDTYPGGYASRVLVTTGNMIKQNPRIVKGFLRGIIRGFRFAADAKNEAEVTKIVMSREWEKDLGWDNFDPDLKGLFGRAASVAFSRDAGVRGLDIQIEQAKADGKVPDTFTMEQVTRLEFQKEAAAEIDAEFGPGGYTK